MRSTVAHRLLLNGKWQLENVKHIQGRKIATTMTIPGDTASTLFENEYIPDPYYGENEKECAWVGEESWKISREFLVDDEILRYENVRLSMSFVDTCATVFINDVQVGSTNNAFCAYAFEVRKYLRDGKNSIAIVFESALDVSKRRAKKLPIDVPATANFPEYIRNARTNTIRKPHCHGGWDWGITLMVSGVYESIALECIENTVIISVTHEQKHNKKGVALVVTAQVHAYRAGRHSMRFFVDGVKREITRDLVQGVNVISETLFIEDPQLWFPAGYGEQPLYNLSVAMDDGARVAQKVGLRDIRVINKKDKQGRSFVITVNGISIFCKGANWVPCDAMPARQTEAVYRRLIEDACKANMNMLRVWGGGQYEREIFYEICDELGILVWQDMMFACSLYPAEDWFLEEVGDEIAYQVMRLQHHACIALWCGDNEGVGALTWYEQSVEKRDGYVANYVRLNDFVHARCREHDPTRVFWPSSPSSGAMDFADNWHDDGTGDMHYWDVWHEGKSLEAYYNVKPRFCSEFGFQSFPALPTVASYAAKEQWNITAPHMEHHQKNTRGNSIILEMFSRYFRIPNSFENQLYLSQVQQALALQMGIEYWRTMRPVCMGTLYWQLNDNWPVVSWSSIDYTGRWKLLHYQVKKSFEPLLVTLRHVEDRCEVWAVNDNLESYEVSLALEIMSFDGAVVFTKSFKRVLGEQSVAKVFETPVKWNAREHFAYLSYENPQTQQKAYSTLCFEKYKTCAMQEPHIRHAVRKTPQGFAVDLRAEKPAFCVSLEQYDDAGVFDDNMFTLLPKRDLTVNFTPLRSMTLKAFEKNVRVFSLWGGGMHDL